MPRSLLRHTIDHHPFGVIVIWLLIAVTLRWAAPNWDAVALEGDLQHLPANAPSAVAEQLRHSAFPDTRDQSELVLVFARDETPLTVEDRQFILDTAFALQQQTDLPLVDVWHEKTPLVSQMLAAPGGHAQLVFARLTNPLLALDNVRVLQRVTDLLNSRRADRPPGLQWGVTGSAAIGGDTFQAMRDSVQATHTSTLVLVFVCLALIYRAPLLIVVPLATIVLALSVSFSLVALAAVGTGMGTGWLKVFTTTRVIVIVVLFGAGTDYCLFLIARYREEMQRGVSLSRAPGVALRRVSSALAGSALTSILGLGVMAIARYGKFASSGPVIALSLAVAMLACLTLAPALLRVFGRAAFWPSKFSPGSDSATALASQLFWERVSDVICRRPRFVLAISLAVLSPLAFLGLRVPVNHDLLSELPPSSLSLQGTQLVQQYFGRGWLAPTQVIVRQQGADFRNDDARFDVSLLHDALYQLPEVSDVRSAYLPAGGDPSQQRRFTLQGIYAAAASGSPLTTKAFVSPTERSAGQVMQLSLILTGSPFSLETQTDLSRIEQQLQQISQAPELHDQPNPWLGAEFYLAGIAPGMRDLAIVTAEDQRRIQLASVIAVLFVLLVIVRQPWVCLYLIATVLLSYWVSMGATRLLFEQLYGESFLGLNWKAPLFLFVILIAVGQDYNVYLVTRVLEEQRRHGPQEGLRVAMARTGAVITSCGVIMAGTFASLAMGSLAGMVQLGVALTLGVLLDTFVVRTILVPCFFAMRLPA